MFFSLSALKPGRLLQIICFVFCKVIHLSHGENGDHLEFMVALLPAVSSSHLPSQRHQANFAGFMLNREKNDSGLGNFGRGPKNSALLHQCFLPHDRDIIPSQEMARLCQVKTEVQVQSVVSRSPIAQAASSRQTPHSDAEHRQDVVETRGNLSNFCQM